MLFRLSNCIGIATPNPDEAVKFYQSKLDMTLGDQSQGLELQAGPIKIFVDPGPTRTPVLELFTTDLDRARKHLQRVGCDESIWRGPYNANIVVDPFGIRWNIFENPETIAPPEPEPNTDHMVKSKICIHTPFAQRAANFYADLLDSPLGQVPDGKIIDSHLMRLKVEDALPLGPALTLHPDFDLKTIDPRSKKTDSVATDPFGLRWKHAPINPENRAVISV